MSLLSRSEKVCVTLGGIASSLTYIGMNYPHLSNQISEEYTRLPFWVAVASNSTLPSLWVGTLSGNIINKLLFNSESLAGEGYGEKDRLTTDVYLVGVGVGVIATLTASFFIAQANIKERSNASIELETGVEYDILTPRAFP